MGWAERNERRSRTAREEAGHVVAVRKLGGRVKKAVLEADDSGTVTYSGLHGFDEAVAALAGPLAAGEGVCKQWDRDVAVRALRGSGRSFQDAVDAADRLVNRHRDDIDRAAKSLYRNGRL